MEYLEANKEYPEYVDIESAIGEYTVEVLRKELRVALVHIKIY